MKTLEFNRNSWHFWLATRIANFKTYNEDDLNICAYLRSVFAGGLVITLLGTLATLIASLIGSAVFHWVGVLLGLIHRKPNSMEIGGSVFLIMITVVYVIYLITTYFKNRTYSEADAPPGFIKSAYRSWKDKTCVRVSFTEK